MGVFFLFSIPFTDEWKRGKISQRNKYKFKRRVYLSDALFYIKLVCSRKFFDPVFVL
jgi:hypothetical protein